MWLIHCAVHNWKIQVHIGIVFAQVGTTGRVIGIDHIKELVDESKINVKKEHEQLLSSGQLKLIGKYFS